MKQKLLPGAWAGLLMAIPTAAIEREADVSLSRSRVPTHGCARKTSPVLRPCIATMNRAGDPRWAGVSPAQHQAGKQFCHRLRRWGQARRPALRSGSWRVQTFSCTGDYLFSRSAVVFGSSHVSTPKTHDLYQISPALKPAARGRAHSAKQIHCGRRTGRGIVHGKVVNEILA